MTGLRQWVHRPQGTWWRRAFVQVHLWLGIGLCLYVVMLSLTGSVLVYRRELTRVFDVQKPAYEPERATLSADELRARVAAAFPDRAIVGVSTTLSRRDPLFRVVFEQDGVRSERAFNPYTGEDLGLVFPFGVAAILWLADLHDYLLLGRGMRAINGIGSILVTVVTLTGAVLWWPGIRFWRRAIAVKWRARWPRINRDLHSASGFWLYLLILNWSVTGIYLAFPATVMDFLDALHLPTGVSGETWGDVAFDWLTRIHFGRWPNPYLKALWFVMGLVPTVLAVTGVLMWWHRAVRPFLRRAQRREVHGELERTA